MISVGILAFVCAAAGSLCGSVLFVKVIGPWLDRRSKVRLERDMGWRPH